MNLIEKLSVEARALGMSYGQYVATLHSDKPRTPTPLKKGERVCIKCGERYIPDITKSGYISTNKKCPKCREDKKKAYAAEKGRTTNRDLKEYRRHCTMCGAEVITTQPPRKNYALYCPECRIKETKRRGHESWLKRKGIKND